MDPPDDDRIDDGLIVLELLDELKEFLGGCALIGLAWFALLDPGQTGNHLQVAAVTQSRVTGTSYAMENRPATVAEPVNESNLSKENHQSQASQRTAQDGAGASAIPQSQATVRRQNGSPGPIPERKENVFDSERICSRERYLAANRARAERCFGHGLHRFWSRRYQEAIGRFEAARDVDPTNPAYLYFLALAYLRLGQVDQAERTLAEAVELEAARPIPNWGRMMERVQGRHRLWLEEARRNRGIG